MNRTSCSDTGVTVGDGVSVVMLIVMLVVMLIVMLVIVTEDTIEGEGEGIINTGDDSTTTKRKKSEVVIRNSMCMH